MLIAARAAPGNSRNDQYLVWTEVHISVTGPHGELVRSHHEEFVPFRMSEPDKIAQKLYDFDVIIVDVRQAARLPMVKGKAEGIGYISQSICHASMTRE